MSDERIAAVRIPNGYLWKRANGQVAAKSSEWVHMWKLLNMAEFTTAKSKDGLKDKTLIIDKDGSLKTVKEYEQISLGRGSYYLAKLPYFLKISKIREIIYCSENICARKT